MKNTFDPTLCRLSPDLLALDRSTTAPISQRRATRQRFAISRRASAGACTGRSVAPWLAAWQMPIAGGAEVCFGGAVDVGVASAEHAYGLADFNDRKALAIE